MDIPAGGGVFLVAGHAGDGVIQDDDSGKPLVVDGVDEAGDAAVDKGAVPNDPYRLPGLLRPGLQKPVEAGNRSPHAEGDVHGGKGRQAPQGVAADVPKDGEPQLVEGVEQPPVGTAGTEDGRTYRQLPRILAASLRLPAGELLADQVLAQLPNSPKQLLAPDRDADGGAVAFNHRVQLLRHNHLIHRLRKVQNQLHRQGI